MHVKSFLSLMLPAALAALLATMPAGAAGSMTAGKPPASPVPLSASASRKALPARLLTPDDPVRTTADRGRLSRGRTLPKRVPELVDGAACSRPTGPIQPPVPYHVGNRLCTESESVSLRSQGEPHAVPATPAEIEVMRGHLRPYQPGDKVWTSEPPRMYVSITIDCPNGTTDAARKLMELDREGSPINEVDCR